MRVVRITIIGALYAAVTFTFSPISYGPIQFGIAKAFKVLVLFDPNMALGIGVGTFFANLGNSFVGPLELVWMPFTNTPGDRAGC